MNLLLHIIMFSTSKYHLQKTKFSNLFFIMIPLLLLSACGENTGGDTASVDPGAPPSLTGGEGKIIVELTDQQAEMLDINHYTVSLENFSFEIGARARFMVHRKEYL